MSLTLNSEKSLEDFINLNLDPAPIVITKGNEYSIVNYTFGDNLTFVTESGPAPANFYYQIYNPMLIQNLVVGNGVTLELTRDIFISGGFDNFGTVTGGNVYEVDVPLVVGSLSHAWESDLGVNEISGGVQQWTDNIGGANLDAPSSTQRPVYSAANALFKDLPSLTGEIANSRKLTLSTNLIVNSPKVSAYYVISGIAQGGTERILEYGQSPNFWFTSREPGLTAQNQFQGAAGISDSRSPILANNTAGLIMSYLDIGGVKETVNALDGVEGSQILNAGNVGSLTNGTFDVLGNGAGSNFYSGSITCLLICPVINTVAEREAIVQYLTDKYLV